MSHATVKPLTAHKAGPLSGRIRVSGDKSISHRALMLGAISTGRTEISGLLEAEDVLNTAKAMAALGASVSRNENQWEVIGRGVGGLRQPDAVLDLGNSGTGTRLLMGIIAGHPIRVTMTGDASLCRRPMSRALQPLREMGLMAGPAHGADNGGGDGTANGAKDRLPLTLTGTADLIPIEYVLPVASAQVKSAVLFAGLHAAGRTTVIEREPTRDHTERILRYFGATVETEQRDGVTRITVAGDAELEGRAVTVPGDPSSAAFIAAAALLVPGSEVTIEGVLVNPTRTGLYLTLQEMGGDVEFLNEREEGGEPVADIRVRHSRLTGVRVPAARAPSMIDEYPVLAAIAGFADGETRMDGLAELKVKESDRLAATAAGLLANGVGAQVEGDSLIVRGAGRVAGGGTVATHLDHRIAMAFLTMGLASERGVTVDDTAMIATSFPQFRGLMEGLGARFE